MQSSLKQAVFDLFKIPQVIVFLPYRTSGMLSSPGLNWGGGERKKGENFIQRIRALLFKVGGATGFAVNFLFALFIIFQSSCMCRHNRARVEI